MKTTELVDELLERFKGWGIDGSHGVLRYLNEAHSILLTLESHQTLAFEPDGDLPTLHTTVADKRVYSMPDNIWRVGGVLLPGGGASRPKGREVFIGGRRYWQINGVTSRDWMSHEDPAQVVFSFQPIERDFFLRAYTRPIELTSTRIEHRVPPPQDALFLLPAAAALIDGVQNGEALTARQYILNDLKPRFWAAMNKGEQSEYTEPVDRGF